MAQTIKSDADTPEIDDDSPSAGSAPVKTLQSKLLGGSFTLLAGAGFVGLINLAYNVATARLLGATGFSHATTVYTLLMMVSCITLSFQLVCAKYVARSSSQEARTAVFATLHQRAWLVSIAFGALVFLLRRPISNFLTLPDPALISLLALGAAFYIPLGVRRGYIQGVHAFGPLAITFMFEGLVRLGGAYLLIRMGMGVKGAVLASALAVIVAYFVAIPSPGLTTFSFRSMAIPVGEGVQAIVFYSGQTIINNSDIVLVKHFFPPAEAGFYAAVALIGRLITMCSWSVANTVFPVSASAGAEQHKREGGRVLATSLLMVLGILSVLIFTLWMIPSFLWKILFGTHFALANYGALAPLLILYAVTTGVYSLSSVIITYEMSRKIANTGWVQLLFAGAVMAGICLRHQNLHQVIMVQLVLMVILLFAITIPLLQARLNPRIPRTFEGLRLHRSLTEEEVMAEFLKSEFHHPEFDEYRHQFEDLVNHPDFENPKENALRQALLFLRRGPMWRELPADTRWFEVELTAEDIARIRFFPRAHWRRAARGSFYLADVMKRIRHKVESSSRDEFFDKLQLMSLSVQVKLINPTVLLIGVDRFAPLTILDGNHRIAAALLGRPESGWEPFRFICGLSPQMMRCCWYHTNFNTLLRYLKNSVRYFSYDAEYDIGRFQEREL